MDINDDQNTSVLKTQALSKKEIEVLIYTTNGYTVRQIANALQRDISTVTKRLISARAKLNAKNIAHAAALFVQQFGYVIKRLPDSD